MQVSNAQTMHTQRANCKSEAKAMSYLLLQTPSRKHQLHPSIPHGAETKLVFSPKNVDATNTQIK